MVSRPARHLLHFQEIAFNLGSIEPKLVVLESFLNYFSLGVSVSLVLFVVYGISISILFIMSLWVCDYQVGSNCQFLLYVTNVEY